MNKKIIIGIILVIIVLIGIFLIYLYIYPHAKCKDIETGWQCQFKNVGEYIPTERYMKIEIPYKEKCEKQEGRWICYGFCMPDYERYCDFPFDDAGKECMNSSECKGKCVTVFNETLKQQIVSQLKIVGEKQFLERINNTCSKPLCEGRCSEYPLRHCNWWEEVNNGKITKNEIICD